MSVIKTKANAPTASNNSRAPSEYDGIWINAGVCIPADEEGGEDRFVRLNRGIAVSDLLPKRMYEAMSPDHAAEAQVINSVVENIQRHGLLLAEGESKTINLELRLYRKQEETDVKVDAAANTAIESALFG